MSGDARRYITLHYTTLRNGNYGRLTKLLLDGGADVTLNQGYDGTQLRQIGQREATVQYALEALDGTELLTDFVLSQGNFIEPYCMYADIT